MRSVLMVNIRSMDDLPKMERWIQKDHFPEGVMSFGPGISRYMSYRVVPPPKGMYDDVEKFGYHNWRVTEFWWAQGQVPFAAGLGPRWKSKDMPDYDDIVTSMSRCSVPFIHVQDFKGKALTMDDPPMLRWLIFMKYPEGVSFEEGEDWYLNVHSKEVMQQEGLTRYFSSPALKGPVRPGDKPPFVRLVEQWYPGFNSWHKSVIDSPPKYTKPKWAKYDKYPFLEPGVDFVSTFILEKPTNDNLRDQLGYIPG
jgi:hypothetical protein